MDEERFIKSLQKALTYEGDDRPALVARIPVICSDIRDIKSDLRWMKYLGGAILSGVALLALKSLGI